jgi:hypothetical protein
MSTVFPGLRRWLCRIADTAQLVITIHAVYFYLVTNFGNFAALATVIWCAILLCINVFLV